MNIKEACLYYTNLKTEQIAVVKRLKENFCFLDFFYKDLKLYIPDNNGGVLTISGAEIKYQEDQKNFEYKNEFYFGEEKLIGFINFETNSWTTLDSFIEYYQKKSCFSYPLDYLIPDGIIIINESGKILFNNYTAECFLKRLGTELLDKFKEIKPVFFADFFQIDKFSISSISCPIYLKNELQGTFIILSDITQIKNKERELMEKSTVIKEIHHRVKNNLQTIISLLRMQKRRINSKLVEKVLNESINRILSIALIHEALSKQELELINIKKTLYNILEMILSNMVDSRKRITGEISGDDVYLSTKLATAVALCITELIQNAIEHAFVNQNSGFISISIQKTEEEIIISVKDDGVGALATKVNNDSSLGMKIIRTITEHNLRGDFNILGSEKGTTATISFSRKLLEEEE